MAPYDGRAFDYAYVCGLEIEEKTGLVARAMQRRAARAEIAKLAETLPDSETKREILRRLSLLED